MNNTLLKKEIKLPEFSNNYVADILDFCLSSGKIDKENYEDILTAYLDNMNNFLIDISYRKNYILINNDDCERLFSNVNYIVGFYFWNAKLDVDLFISKMWKPFELFKEAEKYYFEILERLKERISKLKNDNKIKIEALFAYFERISFTCQRYENIVKENISDLQTDYQDIEFKNPNSKYNGKFLMFNMLESTETKGFVNFVEGINELECQFEFLNLFNPNDIKKIYDNMFFDVIFGSESRPQKYNNLLRPVLQQFLFCCEYSEENAINLSLKKEDVLFVFEDLKNKYLKNVEKLTEFYKATDEKINGILLEARKNYNITDFHYKSLYNLTSYFKYDKKLFGDEFKVANKEFFERYSKNLKSKSTYLKYKEATDFIIDSLTEEETKYIHTEQEIDASYNEYLKNALERNESFMSLSDKTKEYIIKNIPDVRNCLMTLFLYSKNIAFYVE